MMKRFLFPILIALIAVLSAGALPLLLSSQVHATLQAPAFGGVGPCKAINVNNIALGDGQPAQYSIYGELCDPIHGRSQTVQLLIPGATYSHVYWDWPYENPDLYAAVQFFTNVGYSTFDIDRIGIGNSSHPLSSDVNVASNAYVVHELVGRLKAGTISGPSFVHVMLVGHSLGSLVSISEAATYHDVDGVVITGLLHKFSANGLSLLGKAIIPANQDPSGRFTSLDSGYLTTAPNTRSSLLYYAPNSDPNVIASDENTKETVTRGEFNGILTLVPSNLSLHITVPVLVVVSSQDILFCGSDATDCSNNASVYKEEAPFYSSQAHLQVRIIPKTGHSINLHYSAPITYWLIEAWSQTHVAPN
jgi:pimeloyl-ACP methyl ester carboxylesterase